MGKFVIEYDHFGRLFIKEFIILIIIEKLLYGLIIVVGFNALYRRQTISLFLIVFAEV